MVGVREDNSTVLGGEGCAMGSPWCKIRLLPLVLGGEGGWRPTEKKNFKIVWSERRGAKEFWFTPAN